MNELLKNKVIVVSGGTKGIGKGVVFAAAEQGACVVFSGRDDIAGENIENSIRLKNQQALYVHTDILKLQDINNLFKQAIAIYGKIDGYVNYAGATNIGSIVDCNEETYDLILDTNLKACFFAVQNAIRYMTKNENGGSIVVFGSPHDDKGEIDRAPYAFSKAALSVMVTHIAKYYAPNKIRANYITAGWTPTEGELELRKSMGMSEEELRELASKIVPIGRIQEVEDHVPAVLYLLSDFASMVTGSNIRVSGGLFF